MDSPDFWLRAAPIAVSSLALATSAFSSWKKGSSERTKNFEDRIHYLELEVVRLTTALAERDNHIERLVSENSTLLRKIVLSGTVQ